MASEYELFAWNTPNGQKAFIALEEAGADYAYRRVDISQGEQHSEEFKRLSPDGKIPALIHHTTTPVSLFESGAILLYLANRFPALHGSSDAQRAEVTSWTFWQVGQLGPLAGQFGRFQIVNPPNPDALAHFEVLVWRCLDVLEKQLSKSRFLTGDTFTIADIAAFPWVASEQSYLQRYNVGWRARCPELVRWADDIAGREAVVRALSLGAQ